MSDDACTCCSPPGKLRHAHTFAMISIGAEILWLSLASAAIDICPYRPVYSSSALLLSSVFPALIGVTLFATCCSSKCGACIALGFGGVAIFMNIIALGISGQPLQDGCMHTRPCYGWDESANCSVFDEENGATAFLCRRVNKDKEDAHGELEEAGLQLCGQHFHWDHFADTAHTAAEDDDARTFRGFTSAGDCRSYWDVHDTYDTAFALFLVAAVGALVFRTIMLALLAFPPDEV